MTSAAAEEKICDQCMSAEEESALEALISTLSKENTWSSFAEIEKQPDSSLIDKTGPASSLEPNTTGLMSERMFARMEADVALHFDEYGLVIVRSKEEGEVVRKAGSSVRFRVENPMDLPWKDLPAYGRLYRASESASGATKTGSIAKSSRDFTLKVYKRLMAGFPRILAPLDCGWVHASGNELMISVADASAVKSSSLAVELPERSWNAGPLELMMMGYLFVACAARADGATIFTTQDAFSGHSEATRRELSGERPFFCWLHAAVAEVNAQNEHITRGLIGAREMPGLLATRHGNNEAGAGAASAVSV